MSRFNKGDAGVYVTSSGITDDFIINKVNRDRTYDIYFGNTMPFLVRASSDALEPEDQPSASNLKARKKLEEDYKKAVKLSKAFNEKENKRYDELMERRENYSQRINDESVAAEQELKRQIDDFLTEFKNLGRKSRKKRRKNKRKTRKPKRKTNKKRSRRRRRTKKK